MPARVISFCGAALAIWAGLAVQPAMAVDPPVDCGQALGLHFWSSTSLISDQTPDGTLIGKPVVGQSLLSKSCEVPDDIKDELSDKHDGEPVDIVLELGSSYKIRPQSYGHPGIVVDLPSGSTEETGIAIYIDFGSSPMQKVGERQWLYPQKGEVLFDVLAINGDNAEVRYQAIKVGPLKRPRKLVLSQFPNLFTYKWVFMRGTNQERVLATGTISTDVATSTIDLKTCRYTSQTVSLPTIQRSALTGVGTTLGTTDFQMPFWCYGRPRVSVYMSAANMQTGVDGVALPATGQAAGMASGVGVQLINGKTQQPVKLGLQGKIALPEAQQTESATFSLPMKAQYYQTSTSTSAGKLSVTYAVTLNYD
ncbi:protein fhaE [Bordetella bronchiseptica]|nr:protein fhaE [Bordetella bronchiseptica]KFJ58405.1 putative fimD fimbrial adhesin [Bordetella bronchiseptica]MCE7074635.1 protein fhaE [Bordetella bronchiseptica]RFT69979.1 type 1 fimbrial protein [Bordetella bronchiseptica]